MYGAEDSANLVHYLQARNPGCMLLLADSRRALSEIRVPIDGEDRVIPVDRWGGQGFEMNS